MARADLAAIVVEGIDGDAKAGGVGGTGLAAAGHFLGENEQFLTGYFTLIRQHTAGDDGRLGLVVRIRTRLIGRAVGRVGRAWSAGLNAGTTGDCVAPESGGAEGGSQFEGGVNSRFCRGLG